MHVPKKHCEELILEFATKIAMYAIGFAAVLVGVAFAVGYFIGQH
jgi:hypothetical protein